MKKRLGFVSNSSSSSFLIYGIMFEEQDSILFEKFGKQYMEENNLEGEDYDMYEFYEFVSNKLDIGFNYGGEYNEGVYFGESWGDVGDDQTGLEFKTSIEDKIKVFFPDVKFSTYEEAWHD